MSQNDPELAIMIDFNFMFIIDTGNPDVGPDVSQLKCVFGITDFGRVVQSLVVWKKAVFTNICSCNRSLKCYQVS